MEKIITLAEEIFGHMTGVDAAIAEKVKAAVSGIVDEAHGLSTSYALAVASAGKVNATSPGLNAETDAVDRPADPNANTGDDAATSEVTVPAAPNPAACPKCGKVTVPNSPDNCSC